ncbi:MAG: hypothetical protein ABUR63_07630 [Verrucomicrobiota bacterium]
MRFAVCLHGGAVVRSALRLHATDRRAIELAVAAGAEVVAIEAVGERGSAPTAATQALEAGAHRAVRVVEPALAAADSHTTGFVLATALAGLAVDLILCGEDADPEGLGDVPATVAHHMGALYVCGALNLDISGAAAPAGGAVEAVEVNLRAGSWIRGLRVPFNALICLAGDATLPPRATSAAAPGQKRGGVQVLTLADLEIDAALVRRRDDLRGLIEPAPRPLVTLQSAAAVGALLRRG